MMLKVIIMAAALLLSINAFSATCLKFSTEESAELALQSLIPLGTSYGEVKDTLTKACATSNVQEHFYQDSPFKAQDGTEVWSWIKVSEGPYRFLRRLFLKTHVVATIRFNQQGNVIGHKVELQTDSL
jgi:hypothetical protein